MAESGAFDFVHSHPTKTALGGAASVERWTHHRGHGVHSGGIWARYIDVYRYRVGDSDLGIRERITRTLRERGMTSSTAENRVAGEKEKMEKRRALGRGLASLLPGPRVVGPDGGAKAPDFSPAGDAAPSASSGQALKGRSATAGSGAVVSGGAASNMGASSE